MTSLNLNKLAALEDGARVMTRMWEMSRVDVLFAGVSYAHLETVLHEASHAASLGLPFGPDTSRAVTHSISQFGDPQGAALDEEAKAWAIEWAVLRRLGLDIVYEWGDVTVGAAEQGVDEDRLRKFVDTEWADEGADTVMGWLNEMLTKTPQGDT